jgi:radical SAM protein with 4Fe4S-binding SPASM domain
MIVVWRVTQHCNLSCPFCGYDRRVERTRRVADVEEVLRFGAVLAAYQRVSGDTVLVSWMGGEPLLWPALHALTERFTRELGLRVSTTTNGTPLASAAVRTHIVEHYSELTVSVDGIGAAHDDLRGWRGGFAHLRRAIRALHAERLARDTGPLLRANIVLMRETLGDFERLCNELADWGIGEITFNQLGGDDRPEFRAEHGLLAPHAEWLGRNLPRIRGELSQRGVRLAGGPAYMRRLLATASGQHVSIADCGPGESFLFVDEQGRVAPCSFTMDHYGIPIHEIDSAEALQQLPQRFSAMRAASRARSCEDCHSTHVFEKFSASPSSAARALSHFSAANIE